MARSISSHLFLLLFSTKDRRLYIKRRPLSPHPRQTFRSNLSSSPDILGSGVSRLLIDTPTHSHFESRLRTFFNAPQALLLNSGSDANVGLFSAVPQRGDAVYDEYIHASVHDGRRAGSGDILLSRERREFRQGSSSIFVSVESLYSMDGTFAPLLENTQMVEETFPLGNVYLGRGRVARLGSEDKVLARLVAFEKALATTSAVVLANGLIHDYLLNYARPLIYTTSLSLSFPDHPTLGLLPLSTLRFPPPEGINTRPITWPTVPKGKDRVRICLHAREEVDLLVRAVVD
ncbi:PLP-dependent transferase [Coprinopsis sp. MPI-PUGE-AT-0042]|nr:PLP-dependent transferase [Coprinopsis sp. MPI-PUGE-AT-0042]